MYRNKLGHSDSNFASYLLLQLQFIHIHLNFNFSFDASIHLNLELPDYVKVFPDFKEMKKTPPFLGDVNGSRLAYSSPFQASTKSTFINLFYKQ